ncbi:MAG: GTPase HflX [Lentisphaeria bacterium]|nr:GTPase HflX [Lentisphaeria bacterium]
MINTADDTRKLVERAVLIGIRPHDQDPAVAAEHLAELKELVANLNIPVVGEVVVSLRNPQPEYFTGTGKAQEIAAQCAEWKADCLIFDNPLSPSQQRNWEKLVKVCVIDREEVILDIFASRATTREAVLQVELARLHYNLPRLTRAWTHLSRQRGGVTGARGQGETQIETDRRLLKLRIASLEKELKQLKLQRATGRKHRERTAIPHGAIVGYTNVGKSSLLHHLSGAGIYVANQLFATLDPTTRRITLPNRQDLLLTDTVGFVRKLPHSLVEAFKSTLEEAVLADFLILVLDIASPQLDAQWETTLNVLKELGAEEKNTLIVFNKMDLIDPESDALLLARTRALFPGSVYISTKTGEGIDSLLRLLEKMTGSRRKVLRVLLPPQAANLVALAHAKGNVFEENYRDDGCAELLFQADDSLLPEYEPFLIENGGL